MAEQQRSMVLQLEMLDASVAHTFMVPSKRIHSSPDVSSFLMSAAHRDLMTFLMQLNKAMFPYHVEGLGSDQKRAHANLVDSATVQFSDTISKLRDLLDSLGGIIDEVPLDTGPRRFGNVSFRKWHETVEMRAETLLHRFLPSQVLSFRHQSELDAEVELRSYFLGSFGSSQRLDYGTGHELSFMAFLAGIWKLHGFQSATSGDIEKQIVLGVIDPYLALIRRLILIYNLEPAGSHGVWGLDDHSFLPYVFGSAQYGPPITDADPVPIEGSLTGSPDPSTVTNATTVERERARNMYFGAIGFIYDVKKGPFWEHSPTLYDISGVQAGWGKINKGMIKMYNAEVLGKFPVVQHFPFGSLFSWDRDPNAVEKPSTIHASSLPSKDISRSVSVSTASTRFPSSESTRVPGRSSKKEQSIASVSTQAPWATRPLSTALPPGLTQLHSATSTRMGFPVTRNSNASSDRQDNLLPNNSLVSMSPITADRSAMPPPTKAPWAK